MTSTHMFIWDNCRQGEKCFFGEHEIIVECQLSVRRCCDEHRVVDAHAKHIKSMMIIMKAVEGVPYIQTEQYVVLEWKTPTAVIGPDEVKLEEGVEDYAT